MADVSVGTRAEPLRYASGIAVSKDDPAAVNRAAAVLLAWVEDAADVGDAVARCEALRRQYANADGNCRDGDATRAAGREGTAVVQP